MTLRLFLVLGLLGASLAELSCKEGYTLFEKWCYRFDPTLLATYDEALSNCTSTHDNLVSIHDDATNAFITKFASEGVLIGLRYYTMEQELFWSDGSAFDCNHLDPTFITWHEYYGDCAKDEDGVWKNADCLSKHKFVCRRQASDVSTNKECPDKSLVYTTPETIYSPGYPGKYDFIAGSGSCIYKLAAKNGYHIKISFDNLRFDDNQGWFLVYNSWDDKTAYVEVDADFDGLNVIINSNLVLLQLTGSNTGTFKITITAVSAGPEASPTPSNVCPDKTRVYVAPGTILSPGYPSNFNVPNSPPVQCTYLIAAKNREVVLLTVTSAYNSNYGYLYMFGNYTDAIGFKSQNFVTYVSGGVSGKSYNIHSNHAGIVMYNSNPGSFKIAYSVA